MNGTQVYKTCVRAIWLVWLSFVIPMPVGLCRSPAAYAVQAGPNHVVNQVVDNWIAVAQTQCDRRLYEQAKESLLQIRQYQTYFSERQKQKVDELSTGVEKAMSEKTHLLQNIDKVGQLVEEGEFLRARALLGEATKSKVLADEEENRIKATLQRVDAKIAEQRKLMKDLYKQSRRDYKQGNIERARQGFTVVASSGLYIPSMSKTAEEYLAEIEQKPVEDKTKAKHKQRPSKTDGDGKVNADSDSMPAVVPAGQQQPQVEPVNPPVAANGIGPEQFGDETRQGGANESNIKQSYLKAVVRDAQARVTIHLGKAEFSIAKAVVRNARNTLQAYHKDIDQQLYNQYSERLQELSRMIDQQQRQWELRWDTKDSGL
jgi:hypothetical protein